MYTFLSPATIDEASALLKRKKNLRILAGGTDIIIALKSKIMTCDFLMDIKKIPDLHTMKITEEGLEIGAAVTLSEMLASGLLKGWYQSLAQSAASVANVLLRSRATLIGNICNASPAGDMLPPCLVTEGYVHTIAPEGNRIIPVREFFLGVKKHVLAPDEMAVKLIFPLNEGKSVFRKRKRIRGHDLAQVSAAASYTKAGLLRIAFGSAAPTPLLIDCGIYPIDKLKSEKKTIIENAVNQTKPIGDVRSSREYRSAMLKYLTGEVIDEILDGGDGQ
jgi:carbon-monoxide dehydrogenase medium subunit